MEYQAGARGRTELMTENAAVKQLLVAAVRQNRVLATGLEQVTAFQTSYDVFSDAQQQCCRSGSGIRCLFDPWIRDPE